MDTRDNFTSLRIRRDTWSRIMSLREYVDRPKGIRGLETVDEVLQRLLKGAGF